MKRPFGITVLAIIFGAAGISYMMLGFQMTTAVTFGPLPTGTGTWLWGWLVVLTGLAFEGDRCVCRLVEAIFALLGTGTLGYALATTTFPLILLWYLNRDSVKKAFGLVDEY